VIEEEPETIEVIEPKQPQKHAEVLSLWKLEKRVTELENLVKQLLEK
jgi:hypothetical protein